MKEAIWLEIKMIIPVTTSNEMVITSKMAITLGILSLSIAASSGRRSTANKNENPKGRIICCPK